MSNETTTKEYMNENEEVLNSGADDFDTDTPQSSGGMGILADVLAEKPKLPVGRQLFIVAALLLGAFSLGAAPFVIDNLNDKVDPYDHLANSVEAVPGDTIDDEEPFLNIAIGARAAYVLDVREGRVLYEENGDLEWPLASITKLMTALVAREIVSDGAVIPVTEEALSQAGETGFQPGDTFSYRRLSDLILMTSSNDGAYALAAAAGAALEPDNGAAAFVKAMNIRAKELGLNSTYFRNPTGLDISETEAGAYGTAAEVAKLMEYLISNHPDILEGTTKVSSVFYDESGESLEGENTNKVVDAIGTVIASKTGYTTLAGGNLVIAFDAGVGRPVIVVVLGSTHQGRFYDVLKLVEATRAQLKNEI